MLVRLQKYLAESGVASRRASEEIITAGRVAVNGRVIRELGSKVDPEADRVLVDGQPVRPRRKLYVAVNKPAGYVCTRRDPHQRPTIYELLPAEWKNLYTVGRLDLDSEGLIFLTNDGQFSLQVAHPRFGIRKKYHATIGGRVSDEQLRQLTRGVLHNGEQLKADKARILRSSNRQTLVELELSEGKYREVRRMFQAIDCEVIRLERIQIGPIKLGELPSGKWRILAPAEIGGIMRLGH